MSDYREPQPQDRVLYLGVMWDSATDTWAIDEMVGTLVVRVVSGEMESRELHGDMIADMSAELEKRLTLQRELLDYRVIDFGVKGGLSESTASPQ